MDPIALNIPNYFEIIKKPMDIQTIENKLKNYEYNNDEEFQEDLKLIWKNAKEFNSPSTEIFQIADRLENETDQLISLPTEKLF